MAMPMTEDAPSGNNLVLTTSGVDYYTPDGKAAVVFMADDHFEDAAVRQVLDYVKRFGTIDRLTINGHGASLKLGTHEDFASADQVLRVPWFLEKLKAAQRELGAPLAKNIDFDACSTMTRLEPEHVAWLRQTAKELGASIEGFATVATYAGITNWDFSHPRGAVGNSSAGIRAVFNADGSVHGNASMSVLQRSNVLAGTVGQGEVLHGVRSMLRALTMSDVDIEKASGADWLACHDGKSQAEGAACQTKSRPTIAVKTP